MEIALRLVVVTGIALGAPHGGRGPLPLPPGPIGQLAPLGLVDGEGILGVVSGRGPLLQVGRPPSSEQAGAVVVFVDLQHRRHGGVEERPVV